MTYSERNDILKSESFIAQVRIALCDWLEYWAVNGTASIDDGTVEKKELREKTDLFIRMLISSLETYVFRVADIVIGSDIIENAEEVTDIVVKRAVDTVLASALDYLI